MSESIRLIIPINEIKEWSEFTFMELPAIENTLHNMQKGLSISENILNKIIDIINDAKSENIISEKERQTGEDIIQTSIITKDISFDDCKYILRMLYKYENFLDNRLKVLDDNMNEFFSSGWNRLDSIKIEADSIAEAIRQKQEK